MAKNPQSEAEKARRLEALHKARASAKEKEPPEEEVEDEEEDTADDGVVSGGDADEGQGGVGEGQEGQGEEGEKSGEAAGGEVDDKRLADHEDDEEDLKPPRTEEERKQRREDKKRRRERARSEREADRRLMQSMSEQLRTATEKLRGLETKDNQLDLARLDEGLNQQAGAFRLAETKMQEAMKKGDTAAFSASLNARDEAKERWQQLKIVKDRATSGGRRTPTIDTQVVNLAKKFADDHKWYDVQARDEDSKIVLAIDESLVSSGFDPKTEGYWQELRTRVRKYLPHRFEAERRQGGGQGSGKGNGQRKLVGKPGQFGAGARSGSQSRGGTVLSKERRAALESMGVEPGTTEWNEWVKTYSAYDRKHA